MALQPSLRQALIIAGTQMLPIHSTSFVSPGQSSPGNNMFKYRMHSAKMAGGIENVLRPLFKPGGKYAGKVKVIFRNQVQPWHASSTFVHEAGLAVARVAPERFWEFSLALFKNQEEYFDIPTSTLTPIQIREKLAQLASQTGVNQSGFSDLLTLKSSPNGGVDVTDDLKYTVKFSRQNGIHVSPTVIWDGVIAGEVSSSWGQKEWEAFLEKKVVV